MGTAFNGIDIVDIGIYMFAIPVVIAHRYFDRDIGILIPAFDKYDLGEQGGAAGILIQQFHEFDNASFAKESLGIGAAVIFFFPEIVQDDPHAPVEERQFPKAAFQDILVVLKGDENAGIGPELYGGPRLVTESYLSYGVLRNADLIGLF